ncbi:hypothetical protein B9G69_002855 [Bdellovibrio sp. SKB1291214]|uniref:hypothetical protein n=1 Tax=Bdellovibrio sp. SKB1291214 TaxID=1732569 RepID=UPI000B5179DD|nr:hypothetical protein [Bdellovibrio sp. SKB1291214]UYL09512.1 hypothetical protein B9G69_002855 [Bdellovibrio sp. SKB1291214]
MINTSLMGTGYWGGNQNCAYQQAPAQAVNTESDEVQEAKSLISEIKQEIAEKKKEKKQFDREAKRAQSDIKNNISEDYADFMMAHMDSSRRCAEYIAFNKADDGESLGSDSDDDSFEIADNESDSDTMASKKQRPNSNLKPPAGMQPPEGMEAPPDFTASGERPQHRTNKSTRSVGKGANSNMLNIQAFSLQEWQSVCDASRNGAVFGAVCDNPKFRANSSRTNAATCKQAIGTYRTNAQKSAKIQGDIEDLNRQLERAQDDLKDAREDSTNVEGSVCIECMAKNNQYNYQQQSQSNTANLVANVALGAASMYAGYKTNQAISDNNANLGYPTQTPSTLSYGYPYIAQGLYGAMTSGSGQGGFGCGNSMMNNIGGMTGMNGMYGMTGSMGSNVFGYPSSMMGNGMSGMSGGIYMGSGSPYGMSGMNSMYGMNGMSSMNPYSMYGMTGMSGMNGLNTMYGSNAYGMNSQYASMMAMQQQIAQMNYQMSAMNSLSGMYGSNGYSYISPTGLNTTTTLPGGVITGSSNGYSMPSGYLNTSLNGYGYGNTYIAPYNTASSSTTVPGVVPIYNGSTSSTTSGVITGTGR